MDYMLVIKILIIDRYNGVKRVYMRWIRLLIHLFHLYIKTIFIHLIIKLLLKKIFCLFYYFFASVLEMLLVLWYQPAKFSKKVVGFLAAIYH